MGNGRIPDWCADDYAEVMLCEMYHCTPSELDEEDYHRTQKHLAVKGAIQTHQHNEA